MVPDWSKNRHLKRAPRDFAHIGTGANWEVGGATAFGFEGLAPEVEPDVADVAL
jgi:hypothetical protein